MRPQIHSIVAGPPLHSIAEHIVEMAAREAAFFDRLWSVRNPESCAPMVRRRHKQFISEFISYYCCVCDLYLQSHQNAVAEWFVDVLAEEVVSRASRDRFLDPPLFRGDMPGLLNDRYRHGIARRRRLVKATALPGARFLTAMAAEALANLVTDEATDVAEGLKLQAVISQRLDWSSRALTGWDDRV